MAWHRLAATLGMSVRRTMTEVDADEFNSWLAYFELETWDFAGYHQAGIICASVANMMGNNKVVAADFMPLKDHKGKGMSPADSQAVFATMFGG